MRLEGRVVAVTGGAGALGAAVAWPLLDAGPEVTVAARSRAQLESLRASLETL